MRSFKLCLTTCLFCLAVLVTPSMAEPSQGKHHAFRLKPGQDLKREVVRFTEEHGIEACAVVTCVGSLTEAHLRYANEEQGTIVKGPLEIQSLVGCGAGKRWHLHLTVANRTGETLGGHLLDGSVVRTTAEIVLVELVDYRFDREQCPESGYQELKVTPKKPDE